MIDAELMTSFEGRTPPRLTPSNRVTITFITKSSDWELRRNHAIDILADGRPIKVRGVEYDGSIGEGYVIESAAGTLSIKDASTIAAAKLVKLRLGFVEYEVDEAGKHAIADFVRVVTARDSKVNRSGFAAKATSQ